MTSDKLRPGTKAALSFALSIADSACCRKKMLLVSHSVLRMPRPGQSRVQRYHEISKTRSDVLSVGEYGTSMCWGAGKRGYVVGA